MLIFGIDIPIVEIILLLMIIIFILLVESLVIIGLLMSQMNRSRKQTELLEKLSSTLLEIKKAEIIELDKIRRK